MNFRTFILTLALVLCGALLAWSQEGQDWRYWQNLYHQNRAEQAKSPEQVAQWKNRPLEIKQVEINFNNAGVTREVCITCHDGLEPMSASHPEPIGCTVCHGGDPGALDKEVAHATLIYDPRAGTGRRNPSALSVVHLSCGRAGCHSGHADASRNHVERVRRSMMGTLTGMIAGLRFQWAAQETMQAKFGAYSLPINPPGDGLQESSDGKRELEALPFFLPRDRRLAVEQGWAEGTEKVSHHPADGVLRSRCLECHLDGKADPQHPRSQGCAACHVSYSREGLYEGMDPTIDRKERGHMKRHRLTALPEEAACTVCHRAQAQEAARPPLKSPRVRDVHVEAGMECIDCHTSSDVMGDGTIRSRQYEAVEIQCETCHGDAANNPRIVKIDSGDARVLRENRHYARQPVKKNDWVAVSRLGSKLSNVKVHEGNIVTVSKRTGKMWKVPLIKNSPSHRISQHNERLACNACHSSSVPECRGCHLTLDLKESGHLFSSTEIHYREPALMLGPDGRVRPALPQPLRTLNAIDAKGAPLPVIDDWGDKRSRYREFAFTNPLGYSGARLGYTTHPHTTGRQVRGCASCHLSAATLGLGEAVLEMGGKSSGKADRADTIHRGNEYSTLEISAALPLATAQGQPVAGSHQPGARPFNQGELNRILSVGNCLPCHNKGDDPIYRNIDKSYRTANGSRHRALVEKARGAL